MTRSYRSSRQDIRRLNLYITQPAYVGSPLTNMSRSSHPRATSADGEVFNDPLPATPCRSQAPSQPSRVGSHPPAHVEEVQDGLPVDDRETNEPQQTASPEPVPLNMASAIVDLTQFLKSGKSSKHAKAKEPDTFYGTDTAKLRPFLMQCNLNFADRPYEFQEDHHKVLYAISYLRGIAQTWFEPGLAELREDDPPAWYNDYDEFVQELKMNFGPHDAVGEAEANIAKLRMKDSAKIATYIVEFNSLSSLVDWGEGALRHRFYDGLPSRLKDDICRGDGKPSSLAGMRRKAQQCDARYWE